MNGKFKDLLKGLKQEGVLGVAAIDKEGNVIESDIPPDAHPETFGIMCATIIGASNSVNSELEHGSVKRTIVDSAKGKLIIANTKTDLILAVVVEKSQRLDVLFDDIDAAAKQMNQLV